jgi:hypothetical protein
MRKTKYMATAKIGKQARTDKSLRWHRANAYHTMVAETSLDALVRGCDIAWNAENQTVRNMHYDNMVEATNRRIILANM